MEQKLYLDGHWVGAERGQTFEVRNPATGEIVGMVADGGAKETRQAIDAAHHAFGPWAATPPQ